MGSDAITDPVTRTYISIKYGLAEGDQFIIGNPYVVLQRKQYRGDIDEVLVWDRALTAKEVAKLAAPTGKKPR